MSESSCPICGAWVSKMQLVANKGKQHRCNKRVLSAIDAARERGERREPDPTYSDRLKDGFKMLN